MPFDPDDLFGEETEEAEILPTPTPPRALTFNPLTRDFDRDSDGRYVDQHPVDAAVATQLMTRRGAIASAPETGQALHTIDDPTARDTQKRVETIVKAALRRLLQAGDITILAIKYEPANASGLLVQVDYVNERLAPRTTKTASVTFG